MKITGNPYKTILAFIIVFADMFIFFGMWEHFATFKNIIFVFALIGNLSVFLLLYFYFYDKTTWNEIFYKKR